MENISKIQPFNKGCSSQEYNQNSSAIDFNANQLDCFQNKFFNKYIRELTALCFNQPVDSKNIAILFAKKDIAGLVANLATVIATEPSEVSSKHNIINTFATEYLST